MQPVVQVNLIGVRPSSIISGNDLILHVVVGQATNKVINSIYLIPFVFIARAAWLLNAHSLTQSNTHAPNYTIEWVKVTNIKLTYNFYYFLPKAFLFLRFDVFSMIIISTKCDNLPVSNC